MTAGPQVLTACLPEHHEDLGEKARETPGRSQLGGLVQLGDQSVKLALYFTDVIPKVQKDR